MNKKLLVVALVAISLGQGLKAVNPNDLPKGNSNVQSGSQGDEQTNRAGRSDRGGSFRSLLSGSIERGSGRGSSSDNSFERYRERWNRENNNNNNNSQSEE